MSSKHYFRHGNLCLIVYQVDRGVDLRAWPGEEWAPLMLCMADLNNEKEVWQHSKLSVELLIRMIPLDY